MANAYILKRNEIFDYRVIIILCEKAISFY